MTYGGNQLALRGARQFGRYAPYAAKRFAFSNPYARSAMALGQFAYNNREYIGKAASYVNRRRRKAKRKRPSRQDYGSRSAPSKPKGNFSVEMVPGPGGHLSRDVKTIYYDMLNMPQQGIGTTDRISEQIFLKGITFCVSTFNDSNFPIEVHFALVQLKCPTDIDTQLRGGFFRADDVGDKTSLDFVDRLTNNTWDIRYLCNKLNPDNKNIITHRKFNLAELPPPNNNKEFVKYHQKFEQYLPIKRTVHLRQGQDEIPEHPYVWVMWAMPIDDQQMPADVNTLNIWRQHVKVKLHYENIV